MRDGAGCGRHASGSLWSAGDTAKGRKTPPWHWQRVSGLINGPKRHVVVDTLGLLLAVLVTSADIGDRAAAHVLFAQVAAAHHLLALVWADVGYSGSLVEPRRPRPGPGDRQAQ
ncbi:transposase [Streptomyces sp. NPDC002676]